MPDWEDRRRDFDYDLWANRKWLECLTGKGLVSPDVAIFRHLLGAQQIWLSRVQGASPTAFPDIEPSDQEMVRLSEGWKAALDGEDRTIHYTRLNGQALSMRLSDIAHHVVNHGTYHRGELRGLCRARGDEEFPETDFGGFATS